VRLVTQAPKDNGDSSSFSPTDLCAASPACCAATTLSLFAKRVGMPLRLIIAGSRNKRQGGPRALLFNTGVSADAVATTRATQGFGQPKK
jgi:uncharacterized OsmC-like protein